MDNRFLMGVGASQDVNVTGGTNTLQGDGGHNHGGATSGFAGYQWGEINYDRQRGHQDEFMMRFGIPAIGNHNHGGDKRPAYIGVYFIIRIF
jgi:hypothetical protein